MTLTVLASCFVFVSASILCPIAFAHGSHDRQLTALSHGWRMPADGNGARALLSRHGSGTHGKCEGYRGNPHVYNFRIGEANAKVIADGRLLFDIADAYDVPPYIGKRALRMNFQSDDPIIFEDNVLYLEWGRDRILFDTGNNKLFPETAGFLMPALENEGIKRESVTKVIITHAHFDHVAGLITEQDPNAKLIFPNAEVYMAREEYDFWLNPDEVNAGRVPKLLREKSLVTQEDKEFLTNVARTVLQLVEREGRLHLFEDGDEIVEGITAEIAPPHTPGHAMFHIKPNRGDPLLYVGDAIGIESTSINNPWFVLKFDTDSLAGPEARVRLLDRLSDSALRVLTFHGTFPGLGYVVKNDLTFDWKPENWEYQKDVKTMCRMGACVENECPSSVR